MFYVNQETTPVESIDDARAYQTNLLRFLYGRELDWPIYDAERKIVNITATEFEHLLLPADLRARCDMINRVVLDSANGV
jgi:hypothetical protein